MVSTIYLGLGALAIIIVVGWIQLGMARWSAPISGAVGFGLFVISLYTGGGSLMAWGAGLFGWSALLMVVSGAFSKY